MGRARDISKVFSTSTSLSTDSEVSGSYLTQASASTTYQTKATAGLTLLTPGSITNTGGTASIGANGTVTFSAVSSQSFNNVFNSTYTNYRIVYNIEHTVGLVVSSIRLRASGTDASGANYNYQSLSADNTISGGRSQNQTSAEFALISTSVGNNGSYDIYRPFLAEPTSFVGNIISRFNSPYGRTYWGEHTLSTSYDGFTLILPSGAMTGSVSVYGYNK